MYDCLIVLIFYPTPTLRIPVYTILAQVVRLTTLPIDFNIKLPTNWYIAILVPMGCWERADLLALVCGVFCEFVTFPLVSWVRCGT